MKGYRKLNLQYFAEQTGVEEGAAAESQEGQVETQEGDNTNQQVETEQTGADKKQESTSIEKQPEETEKAFAARLAKEREKIEQQYGEKYKDHDKYTKLAEFVKQTTGEDIDSVLEQIELQQLQQEAQQNNLSPEALKRIRELEQKIDGYEQKTKEEQYNAFVEKIESEIDQIVENNEGVKREELLGFMHENGISNPEIAWKAMKPDVDLEQVKKQAITDYVNKKLDFDPFEKSGGSAVTTPNVPKNFEDANTQAMKYLEQQMKKG